MDGFEKLFDLGVYMEKLTSEEKEELIRLICNEQIHGIIKKPRSFANHEYKMLEALKVKIKKM